MTVRMPRVGRSETPTATKVTIAATRSRPEWAASAKMPRLPVTKPTPSLSSVRSAAAMTELSAADRFSRSAWAREPAVTVIPRAWVASTQRARFSARGARGVKLSVAEPETTNDSLRRLDPREVHLVGPCSCRRRRPSRRQLKGEECVPCGHHHRLVRQHDAQCVARKTAVRDQHRRLGPAHVVDLETGRAIGHVGITAAGSDIQGVAGSVAPTHLPRRSPVRGVHNDETCLIGRNIEPTILRAGAHRWQGDLGSKNRPSGIADVGQLDRVMAHDQVEGLLRQRQRLARQDPWLAAVDP